MGYGGWQDYFHPGCMLGSALHSLEETPGALMLGSAGERREIGPGGSGLTDGHSLGTD